MKLNGNIFRRQEVFDKKHKALSTVQERQGSEKTEFMVVLGHIQVLMAADIIFVNS